MNKSKVYFVPLSKDNGESRLIKLERVIKKAGISNIDFKDKFVAIKMHFGEPGNLAYLRSNYVRVLVNIIKELGGKPFLTDCNTLYVGGRKNALDHIESANINGFTPLTTGCQIIIADGLKGSDDIEVPFEGGKHFKTARIGRAIEDCDVFISLTHFKGHEATGFGGALKNIGMGCGSRAGKMQMHAANKPEIDSSLCIGCGSCAKICAHDAPIKTEKKYHIDHEKCVGCARCIAVCPKDAIKPDWDGAFDDLCEKIAEYTKAVVDKKPSFHISLVIDVSPNCDCHNENGMAIVPDIGFLASFDPVALDKACADLVNKAPIIKTSVIGHNENHEHKNCDKFKMAHPTTEWIVSLEHGEKLNIGTQSYELIEV